jgi:hypothetical protein
VSDPEVILKGEIHTSRGDLVDERELLVDGVDCLVLEGSEDDAEYSLRQHWYGIAMLISKYLFMRPMYPDKAVLEDITEAQGGEVRATRESNASILENSHILARVTAAIGFFVLFSGAAFAGITGNDFWGVSLLIGSGLIPLLFLRAHESRRSSGSRDEQMADVIAEAAEEGDRVVAIVGAGHAGRVSEFLPESLDTEQKEPVYPLLSWQHLKDVFYPAFLSISVLWVFYSLFVAYARFASAL